ncbi:hypothetical protein CDD81_4959 [Ophiocordyceps australis]|uniref:Inactive metallocarboxypeptidase ECM14 n=1 Tax=Ophiocordyceps australis TaxID=1399860 RepID=A0A2C5XVB2_9HYPO|nr:hypothetical protein CDD81_4959 [Ophiocordyceps australis]
MNKISMLARLLLLSLLLLSLLLLLLLQCPPIHHGLSWPWPSRLSHGGQVVLRFTTTSPALQTALLDAAAHLALDVWAKTPHHIDVRLRKNQVESLCHAVPHSLCAEYSVLIPDVAAAIARSLARTTLDTQIVTADHVFFQDYQPISVIDRWMRLVEAMFPSHVEYISIAKSFEARDIAALRVGAIHARQKDWSHGPRKTILVTGSLHAREWIATTTVNYLAWSLMNSFGKESFITKLLQEFDFVFIPVVNPDGVDYSWKVDRLWRKSRQPTSLPFCRGFDLDHAFGYGWNSSHVQSDACSEEYPGDKPFEAVEAMQLAAWARNQSLSGQAAFIGLVDLHAYSQQILFPFSYSCSAEPPNLENLEEVAAGMAKAIRLSNGEIYSASSACPAALAPVTEKPFAPGGGSALDWFYHELGAHFSYQIKLRDTGSYGFLLPREQIVPTGQEALDAIKYLGDFLLGNNGIEKAARNNVAKTTPYSNKDGNRDQMASQELRRLRMRT